MGIIKTKLKRHNLSKALLKNIQAQMKTTRVYRADMKQLRERYEELEKQLAELNE